MRVKWNTEKWQNVEIREGLSHRHAEPSKKVLVKKAEPAKPAQYRFGHGEEAILVSPAISAKEAVYKEIPEAKERLAVKAEYSLKPIMLDFDVDETQLHGEKDKKYIYMGSPPEKIFVPQDAIYYSPEVT